jgi:hypothetical protein
MTSTGNYARQQGAALFVVMVLLIAIAWFALSSFRISSQHLQIVGNSEVRQQAAAQQAIEQTISSNMFTKDPAAVAASPIIRRCRRRWSGRLHRAADSHTEVHPRASDQDDGARRHPGGGSRLPADKRRHRQPDRGAGAAVASGDSLCAYSNGTSRRR